MPQYSPEVQKALARVRQVQATHEDELFRIPGVHAIYVAPKTTRGKRTAEFALVVHVVRKKPASELEPTELIPPVIEGVSTDVVEAAPLVASAAPATTKDDMDDSRHYPYVLGGVRIASESKRQTTYRQGRIPGMTESDTSEDQGTLGCVAINLAMKDKDKSKMYVALTNAHVLFDVLNTTKHDGAAVGQPDRCSVCCKSLDHTIGHVDHDGKFGQVAPDGKFTGFDSATKPESPPTGIDKKPPTGIDAAFVTLDPDVQWCAKIIKSGQGDSITTEGVAGWDIVDGDKQPLHNESTGEPIYPIHKRGARTGWTEGWLIDTHASFQVTSRSQVGGITKEFLFRNQLFLIPTAHATQHVVLHGDSGSVVLNSSNKVIGLVHSGPKVDTDPLKYPFYCAAACPIAVVQDQLGVEVAAFDDYRGVGVNGINTVPKPAAAPHAFADLPAGRAALRQSLEAARAELATTELGRRLDGALHRHFGEIRGLVNANKRTAAVWRRVGGPAWVGEALKCLLDRGRKFPAQLEGRGLGECISRLAAVLRHCGSQGLVDDMALVEPELRGLAGRSCDEVFAAWRTQAAT